MGVTSSIRNGKQSCVFSIVSLQIAGYPAIFNILYRYRILPVFLHGKGNFLCDFWNAVLKVPLFLMLRKIRFYWLRYLIYSNLVSNKFFSISKTLNFVNLDEWIVTWGSLLSQQILRRRYSRNQPSQHEMKRASSIRLVGENSSFSLYLKIFKLYSVEYRYRYWYLVTRISKFVMPARPRLCIRKVT
jgi:hypothetical protein